MLKRGYEMWYKAGVRERLKDAREMGKVGSGEARRFLFESDKRNRVLTFLFWTVVSALTIHRVWEALR